MEQNILNTISQPVFYILLVLSIKKSHGYEIMKKVSEFSNNHVHLGPGTLYTAIKRLVDTGLIYESKQDHNTRRKYYEITEAGRDIVNNELEKFSTILHVAHSHNLFDTSSMQKYE